MFTRIIVGFDGKHGGRDALVLAAADAEIVVVNAFAYEQRPNRGSLDGYEEFLREDVAETAARDVVAS